MVAMCSGQTLMQRMVNWNGDLDPCLLLLDCQNPVTDVLLSHPHHITTTLSCVKQQREREACLCADPVLRLELRDVVFAPSLEASRFNLDSPHAHDRIVFPPALIDGETH